MFIPDIASSEALPWGSNLVSGASAGAIKVAAEFTGSGITFLDTDPTSSRLDSSEGGVRPVFEGVAVNNVAAGSSNQGTTLTRSSLDLFDDGVRPLFESEDFPPDENESTKDNSYSGGCETLETPNIFMFPSVLRFITILIWSCFYFRKIYSSSQSRSCFI